MPDEALYEQYFLDRRKRPRLWPCATLFIDLLGVRAKAADRRRAGIHLRELEQALRGSIRNFLRDDSPWPAAFFSDTLVIAVPILQPNLREAAVGGLIAQAGWLQWDLTRRGFFLRGALTVGKLHLRQGLIFGPALVDAYDLEVTRAVHPRIILGAPALKVMKETLADYADPVSAPHNWELLVDQDGETFIDYLGSSIVDYIIDPPEPGLREHRDLISERLRTTRSDRRVWEKYRWSAEYHNAVCDRFFKPRSAASLKVKAAVSTRALRTYV